MKIVFLVFLSFLLASFAISLSGKQVDEVNRLEKELTRNNAYYEKEGAEWISKKDLRSLFFRADNTTKTGRTQSEPQVVCKQFLGVSCSKENMPAYVSCFNEATEPSGK